ncbi:acetate kinase [Oscillatoria sp. FACHB-1407]|uniref:acetate kinase n=1 Tax=Oscillatoria sp. FACHB-1407 TaxID=2692847 RepID=UPI001686D7E9|nr:acetate kinase [Oscillatoria sp. FACHB-1407]MBD2462365.1 acetate kinase [Oscillatoria sp. FACHB-1407]
MKILVLNAGSSSQKSCLYALNGDLPADPPEPVWEAHIDWTHQQGMAEINVKVAGITLEHELPSTSRTEVTQFMLETLWSGKTQVIENPKEIEIVGHRVVHGGQEYQSSTRVNADVKAAIARLASFAPVHNPANLEGIEVIEQVLGDVPQVAVFDTAFHAHLPPATAVYPIPYKWFEQGIRRYGFHGISHQYCAHRAAQLLNRDLNSLRLITCHLGNGCSLAAIAQGHSIDTTMGFTPLEGLMMGSRSGSVDPGILIHLLRQEGYTADQLDQMLNKESGLKGVSGISADVRRVREADAQGNAQAQLALEVYVHRLRSQIGSLLPALGGLDALVFTAGVGENDAQLRAATCEAFGFLGLTLDPQKNNQKPVDQDIATPDSAVRVLVIHTQEDWAIAQECWKLVH